MMPHKIWLQIFRKKKQNEPSPFLIKSIRIYPKVDAMLNFWIDKFSTKLSKRPFMPNTYYASDTNARVSERASPWWWKTKTSLWPSRKYSTKSEPITSSTMRLRHIWKWAEEDKYRNFWDKQIVKVAKEMTKFEPNATFYHLVRNYSKNALLGIPRVIPRRYAQSTHNTKWIRWAYRRILGCGKFIQRKIN